MATDVATFQGSLSRFQDDLNAEQSDERATIAGSNARRDLAVAATKEMQIEWTITSAKNGNDIFVPLQGQGKEEVMPLLLAPTKAIPPPPAIAFPLDKLGKVALTMQQLSTGQSPQADIEFLVNYGIAVNKQMKSIEGKTQVKPKGASPEPAPAKK